MKFALTSIIICFLQVTFAQERCLTDYIPANKNRVETQEDFQAWLTNTTTQQKAARTNANNMKQILEVPVVFHIIHNGGIIGQGLNLSTARIEEQLEILNNDFARRNADRVNTLPQFENVAADTEIKFIFAKQDPYGLPTDAILRVRGSKSIYNTSSSNSADDVILKSESRWPPEDYLNIYVADIGGGFLGYAQFPFTNLEGLEQDLNNYRPTDGVVVDYKWVGNNPDAGNFESLGRTLTHEMGHFLGLIHIWANSSNCNADDYCLDTPPQSFSSSGCNLNSFSCETLDMVQNYMDYSDDDCMNIFTLDQKFRMRTVLQNSPLRKSLLTSPGLNAPPTFANDLGLLNMIDQSEVLCSDNFQPEIVLLNYGTSDQTNISVQLFLNGNFTEEIIYNSIIKAYEKVNLSFSTINVDLSTNNVLSYKLIDEDNNQANNVITVNYEASHSILLPVIEDFEDNNISLSRNDNSAWNLSQAPDSTALNTGLKISYFESERELGSQDYLITKVLDISSLSSAELSFSYAYSPRGDGVFNDGLIVGIIGNCETELSKEKIIFERYGQNLATTSGQNTAFTTSGPLDWRRDSFNITPYLSDDLIQVVFIGVNGGGNNLFLDNISITSAELERLDLGIRRVRGVTPVTCQKEVFPSIEFKNFGYENIESLDLDFTINGRLFQQNYNNIDIFSGFSQEFTLSIRSLEEGENNISIAIDKINGEVDTRLKNNLIEFDVFVNEEIESIPVRETFDNPTWLLNTDKSAPEIEIIEINNKNAVEIKAFDSPLIGGSSRIVSPNLETKNQSEGALRLRYSYASRNGYNDKLKIYLSNNCGRSYDIEVYNEDADVFAIRKNEEEWIPESDEDWGELFIDISEHLIWNELRVLVEFQNGGGNNFYLDGIEFLTDSDPNQPSFLERLTVFPVPAVGEFFVTVNVPTKETLNMKLIDMSGKIVFDENFPNSLNQTFRLLAPSQSGFYLLKVSGKQIIQTKRLYIRP